MDCHPTENSLIRPALMFRPWPKKGEGLRGYLLRLVDANCLSGIKELLRLTVSAKDRRYLNQNYTNLGASQIAELVSSLRLPSEASLPLAEDPFGFYSISSFPATDIQRFLYDIFRRDEYRVWCPQCLQEEGFLRSEWDCALTTRCFRHGCLLVDRCSACEKPVRWKDSTLCNCHCGFDLKRTFAQGVKLPTLDVPEFISDSDVLQRLLTILLMRSDDSSGVLNICGVRSMGVIALDAVLQTITLDDVTDVHRFQSVLFREMSLRFAMCPELGPRFAAAPLLNGLQVHPEFDRTLMSAASAWLRQWKESGASRRPVEHSSLRAICIDSVRATLGVDDRGIRALHRYGLLIPDESVRAAPRRARPVTVESVLRLLQRMTPSKMDINLMGKRLQALDRLNLVGARQQWKFLVTPEPSWEPVMFDETMGISSLVIAVPDEQFNEDVVTVQKAAELLSIDVGVVFRAVASGFIHGGKVARGARIWIPRTEVERVKVSYIFAVELASRAATSVPYIIRRLGVIGILPVLSKDEAPGIPPFFCRHRVNAAIAAGGLDSLFEREPRKRYSRSRRYREIQQRYSRLM